MKKVAKITFISMFIIGLILGITIGVASPLIQQENFINTMSLSVAVSMIAGAIGIVYSIVKNTKYVA
jgi:hypothetical protein